MRTRYFDDYFRAVAGPRVRQLVVLAAGLRRTPRNSGRLPRRLTAALHDNGFDDAHHKTMPITISLVSAVKA